MKLQLRKGPSGKWYVRLVARNGRVVFATETHSSRAAAKRIGSKLMGLLSQAVEGITYEDASG